MKKRSINELLRGLDETKVKKVPAAEKKPAQKGMNPAEVIGRALLDRLGASTGLSEEELVDFILEAWTRDTAAKNAEADDRSGISAENLLPSNGEKAKAPVSIERPKRLPMPMRGMNIEAPAIDYTELSSEQFRELKRQLKKAGADGKRVRL